MAEQQYLTGDEGEPLPEIPGYVVERLLGRGGFGIVYAGRAKESDRLVAIKVARLDQPRTAPRIRREIEALQLIGPPAVPTVYDSGETGTGQAYFCMEYVPWPILTAVIAENPSGLPLDRMARATASILGAIEATHARGLVHRDLKPDNIFVGDGRGEAKLVDFGIVITRAAVSETEERIAGSAGYMSPEQCEGRPQVDERADIYSLGVILFEMLTGRPPFAGTAAELSQAHIGRRPPRPSTLRPMPEAIEEAVLRCLAKDPTRRWESVSALRTALLPALKEAAGTTTAEVQAVPLQSTAASSATLKRTEPREKRLMGLVYLPPAKDLQAVKKAIQMHGGHLAHAAPNGVVAVFDADAGSSPAQRALRAAEGLVRRQFADKAILDFGPVTLRKSAGGVEKFMNAAFMKGDSFPGTTTQPGITVKRAAADMLPRDGLGAIAGRDDLFIWKGIEEREAAPTVMRAGGEKLVGREQELETLVTSAVAATADKVPTIATVIAEAGHGKSSVLNALLLRLGTALPRARTLVVSAAEAVGADTGETIRLLMSRVLGLPREPTADDGRAALARYLDNDMVAEVWPAVALTYGWLSREDPDVQRLSAAPGVLRGSLVRAAGETLRRLAAEGPVLLMLDDAHFADPTSLDALEFATRGDADLPLWVCALARPSFEDTRPTWAQRAGRQTPVRIGPLDAESAAALCRQLLLPADAIPVQAIELLVTRTRGIPLLMEELCRGLKRDGVVRQHTRGGTWYLATDELERLPDLPLVDWLTERELAALPPEMALHTQLLALLGAEFDLIEIEGVMQELDREGLFDSFQLDAQVLAKRLEGSRVLVRHRTGRLSFRHALVRDAIVRLVPAELRQSVHRAATRYYHRAANDNNDQTLARLAFHTAESGDREQAGVFYLTLAERVASRHAYLEAEQMFSRALDLIRQDERDRRFSAFNGRGQMRYRIGRHGDALQDLEKSRDLAAQAKRTSAEIHALLDQATVLDWTNQYHRSQEMVAEAERLAGEGPEPLLAARLHLGAGRSFYRFSKIEEARRRLWQAVNIADSLGDDGYETLVISFLILGLTFHSIEESERVFGRLVALCEGHGDRMHLAGALNNRRVLWIARKDVKHAMEDGLRCLTIGRELGIVELEYTTEYNLGELLFLAGDLDAAWPHVKQAVHIESRRPTGAGRTPGVLLEARMLAYEGRKTEARQVLDRMETEQKAAVERGDSEALLLPMERALADMVELLTREATDDALWDDLEKRAMQFAAEHERIEVAENRGLALLRTGCRTEAQQVLTRALELAATIPNVMNGRIQRLLAAARAN